MRIDQDTKSGRRALTLGWLLVRFLRWSIGLTLRKRIVAGEDLLRSLQDETRPVILSFWHDRTFFAADFIRTQLTRHVSMTLMTSHSRDGSLVSKLVEGWGVTVIRGSSSKGGVTALRGMVRAVKKTKTSPIMVPDGPRGPKYQFKGGPATLSQLTGIPVLPLGFAAERCWYLKSWDRLIIPKPFSRAAWVLGDPVVVERGTDEEVEEQRRTLQAALNDATRRAEEAVGSTFPNLDVHPDLAS